MCNGGVMSQDVQPLDLLTSAEASELLPPTAKGKLRRIGAYRRDGRITPVMRAGTSKRSPLLFSRKDVEALRDEIIATLEAQLRGERA